MKRLILLAMLIPALCLASGWDLYQGPIFSNAILPITANTGQVGTSANAFNSLHADSLFCADSLVWWKTANGDIKCNADSITLRGNMAATGFNAGGLAIAPGSVRMGNGDMELGTAFFNGRTTLNGGARTLVTCFEGTKGIAFGTNAALATPDSTKGWRADSGAIWNKYAGGKMIADSGRFGTVLTAKDTCLEVALFTRTCTRDTLAFMTGADSLTASYIVSAFATRGAITTYLPYIGGIVGGKLVIDRNIADTAKFDRYSVVRILQR
jgi:hypothetical protein